MAENDSTSTTAASAIPKVPRWADDVPEEPKPPSTSAAAAELKLSIDGFLDDSNIQSVTAGDIQCYEALCICPTRELAIQNMEVLLKMGKFTGITSKVCCAVDIANFRSREARTTQSGFKENSMGMMMNIVKYTPKCQVLLFSATFNNTVKDFVKKIVLDLFVHEYNQLFVQKEEPSLDSVKQYKVKVPNELSKITVIKDKIMELSRKAGQMIIFVHKSTTAGILHKELSKNGYEVTTIQDALNQEDRDKIVKEFKDGLTQVLISTDLLARGFDQLQVNLVVNFDLPVKHHHPSEPDFEVYLHRIGTAARFGRKGAVFNLLCDRDARIMEKIERHFKHYVTEVPSWESDEQFEDALKKAGLM